MKLVVALLFVAVRGDMYDVLAPAKLPGKGCDKGCAPWASQNATVASGWSGGVVPSGAGSSCAQLARAPGLAKPVPVLDPTGLGGGGAFCACAEGSAADFDYCVSAEGVPEQVNVQLAAPDTVVVAFVTFEASVPAGPPEALVGRASGGLAPVEAGAGSVTHAYVTPSGEREYLMHFVTLRGLEARGTYFFKVRSGAPNATWSGEFAFRAPYGAGDGNATTRIAIFGDMGIYSWNNMANLKADAASGAIDLVVQMGDHSYNMGGEDERRGDAYMEAYEEILTQVPWLPVVGNHEFYDGDELRRYLNQTDGSVVAFPASNPLVAGAASTAESALGRLLATGNHHGLGTHGGTPSGTSRWYSADFGLVHLVGLDLNMYNGVDTCGETCRRAQLAWLEKDLRAATANRARVPWIVAFSHYPLYCSNCPKPGPEGGAQDPWWQSETCEFMGHSPTCATWDAAGPPPRRADSPQNDDMVPDFEPLFFKYGVDVYASGHIHDYEWIYPTYNATPVAKNFSYPKAPVHLVTGNGGPPTASSFDKVEPYSHSHSTIFSYTRLVVHNATHMTWIQVANSDSRVIDELTIVQDAAHAPFSPP